MLDTMTTLQAIARDHITDAQRMMDLADGLERHAAAFEPVACGSGPVPFAMAMKLQQALELRAMAAKAAQRAAAILEGMRALCAYRLGVKT